MTVQHAVHDPPVHHVGAEHGGVVRVGVLLPLARGHRLPAVVEHVLARPDLHRERGGDVRRVSPGASEARRTLTRLTACYHRLRWCLLMETVADIQFLHLVCT